MAVEPGRPEPLEEVVSLENYLLTDPFQPARDWKSGDPRRKVVACFPVYAPVEIVDAGGMLPIGLFGGGGLVELTHADARFQSFVCSIAKSTLELGFQERLNFVDGVIFSNICDVARNLSTVYQRNFERFRTFYLHYPQGAGPGAVEFMYSELNRLRAGLEEVCGAPITEIALRASIRRYNRLRGHLRALYEIRRNRPQDLPASELYALLRGATLVPADEFLRDARARLEALAHRERPPRDRLRVLVEGSFCEQPPLELIRVMEDAGCYIVDDDFAKGWRWFAEDLPEDGDPLYHLASAYVHRSVYSSVRHDARFPRALQLLQKARTAKAQAIIFLVAKFCEPGLLDYAVFKDVLEKERFPHLFLEFEEKMFTYEKMRNNVETFVESLLLD
ncbi:MAG: 2-hydroxyacyl-CoA dehydratase [bacterium JZ-2024 1]